jgi:hypothetical protein
VSHDYRLGRARVHIQRYAPGAGWVQLPEPEVTLGILVGDSTEPIEIMMDDMAIAELLSQLSFAATIRERHRRGDLPVPPPSGPVVVSEA